MLRRVYCPDAYSSFGAGGLHAYAYCVGDPVNKADPSGHLWGPLKKPGRALDIIPAKKYPGLARWPVFLSAIPVQIRHLSPVIRIRLALVFLLTLIVWHLTLSMTQ